MGNEAWGPEHISHFRDHQPEIPKTFSSVTEARDSLAVNGLTFNVYALGRKAEHTPSKYSTVLQRWSAALDAFLASHEDNLTDREICGVHALKMQRLILCGFINIGVNRSDVDDQTIWDKNYKIFEDIVSLAEAALLDASGNSLSGCTTLFTLDIGFIGSLYDVARRCRDPCIRRRAIYLLRSSARQEGFWDGQLAARAAERVVEIEERGLNKVVTCSDVPDWARISGVFPVFDLEKRVVMARFSRIDRSQTHQTNVPEILAF